MTRSILDIDRLITDYNLYLTLEKGASANTREGYVRDVRRFLKWLSDGKGEASTLREVTTDVLRLYLGDLNDVGHRAEHTRAHRIVVALLFRISRDGRLS